MRNSRVATPLDRSMMAVRTRDERGTRESAAVACSGGKREFCEPVLNIHQYLRTKLERRPDLRFYLRHEFRQREACTESISYMGFMDSWTVCAELTSTKSTHAAFTRTAQPLL